MLNISINTKINTKLIKNKDNESLKLFKNCAKSHIILVLISPNHNNNFCTDVT